MYQQNLHGFGADPVSVLRAISPSNTSGSGGQIASPQVRATPQAAARRSGTCNQHMEWMEMSPCTDHVAWLPAGPSSGGAAREHGLFIHCAGCPSPADGHEEPVAAARINTRRTNFQHYILFQGVLVI